MRKLMNQPLLHFLLFGALLFIAKASLPMMAVDYQPIIIGKAEVARVRADWLRDTARPPTDAEFQASLDRHVDEEILLREALRLRLDERDPVARERMLMNMRFAFPGSTATDEQLLGEARQLQMNTRDLVVRRRLVQVMEHRIAASLRVSDEVIDEYVSRHPERYGQAERFAFRHVYFNGDSGPDAEARARAALRGMSGPQGVRGDVFLLGDEFPPQTPDEIARYFGEDFARVVARSPRDEWTGPVRSAYGWHLVRVDNEGPVSAAPPATLRMQAAYAWLAEHERDLLSREMRALRGKYPVQVMADAGDLRP